MCELINAECVDRCIQNLKLDEALEPDGLNTEHLRYAHPDIAVHICALFRSIILHDYVSKDFGSGIVIPLINDKTGDLNHVNSYRGIKLISVISKLFELVLLEICEQFPSSDELQFGFIIIFFISMLQKMIWMFRSNFALRSTNDVQLIILRIDAAPYLFPHWISQRHAILLITTNYMLP